MNTYDPLECKLVVDGKEYSLEGVSGDIYSVPFTRKWWKLNDLGNYEITCKDGLMLQVTPKDPEEFYNKYLKDLPRFEVEDLHGKTLEIIVGKSHEDGYETTIVMGLDATTGMIYLLSSTQTYKEEIK